MVSLYSSRAMPDWTKGLTNGGRLREGIAEGDGAEAEAEPTYAAAVASNTAAALMSGVVVVLYGSSVLYSLTGEKAPAGFWLSGSEDATAAMQQTGCPTSMCGNRVKTFGKLIDNFATMYSSLPDNKDEGGDDDKGEDEGGDEAKATNKKGGGDDTEQSGGGDEGKDKDKKTDKEDQPASGTCAATIKWEEVKQKLGHVEQIANGLPASITSQLGPCTRYSRFDMATVVGSLRAAFMLTVLGSQRYGRYVMDKIRGWSKDLAGPTSKALALIIVMIIMAMGGWVAGAGADGETPGTAVSSVLSYMPQLPDGFTSFGQILWMVPLGVASAGASVGFLSALCAAFTSAGSCVAFPSALSGPEDPDAVIVGKTGKRIRRPNVTGMGATIMRVVGTVCWFVCFMSMLGVALICGALVTGGSVSLTYLFSGFKELSSEGSGFKIALRTVGSVVGALVPLWVLFGLLEAKGADKPGIDFHAGALVAALGLSVVALMA